MNGDEACAHEIALLSCMFVKYMHTDLDRAHMMFVLQVPFQFSARADFT